MYCHICSFGVGQRAHCLSLRMVIIMLIDPVRSHPAVADPELEVNPLSDVSGRLKQLVSKFLYFVTLLLAVTHLPLVPVRPVKLLW